MKHLLVALVLAASPAVAQQAQTPDPVTATYMNLLTEANGRVASLSGQLAQVNQIKANLEARIGVLQKELDATKPKATAEPSIKPTDTPAVTEPPK